MQPVNFELVALGDNEMIGLGQADVRKFVYVGGE
jgi:hypothetical protein